MNTIKIFLSFVLVISCSIQGMGRAPYHSAGFAPYAIDTNNKKWILVGLEPFRGNQAFDFGGKKDDEDHDDSRYTAAREGTEELLFLFDVTDNFNRIVKIYNSHKNDFKLYKAGSSTYDFLRAAMKNSPTSLSRGYVTYFVKIDYNPTLPQNFINRRKSQMLPSAWIEKNQLVWLPLDEIIRALNTHNDDSRLYVQSSHGAIKLFPHFAQSLRTALKNGTLAQLQ